MIDIITMAISLSFGIIIGIGLFIVWALYFHYVTFWKVVEGIREYLIVRYIRNKVI